MAALRTALDVIPLVVAVVAAIRTALDVIPWLWQRFALPLM